MEKFFEEVFAQWGIYGVVVLAAAYIIWENIKNKKANNQSERLEKFISDKISKLSDESSNIKSEITGLKQSIKSVEGGMANIHEKFDYKISVLNEKIEERIDLLEQQMDTQPEHILNIFNQYNKTKTKEHNNQIYRQIQLAPKLHKVMGFFLDKIKCDHVFIGSFHNGTSSLSGIPYYKFDIVAEKFNPNKISRDVEFAHMYKDVDILRHDRLPIELLQNDYVHYVINPDKSSTLEEVDDILYRRMCGRDIKQLAVNLLHDVHGNPMGFVGCVKYDYEELDFNNLQKCVNELEALYSKEEQD